MLEWISRIFGGEERAELDVLDKEMFLDSVVEQTLNSNCTRRHLPSRIDGFIELSGWSRTGKLVQIKYDLDDDPERQGSLCLSETVEFLKRRLFAELQAINRQKIASLFLPDPGEKLLTLFYLRILARAGASQIHAIFAWPEAQDEDEEALPPECALELWALEPQF